MCKYCNGKSDISDLAYPDGSTFSNCSCRVAIEKHFNRNMLIVAPVTYENGEKHRINNYVFPINYCPMCGEKLGE